MLTFYHKTHRKKIFLKKARQEQEQLSLALSVVSKETKITIACQMGCFSATLEVS